MSKKTKYNRRHFLSSAAMSLGAAELGMIGFANARFIITGGIGHNLPQEAPKAFADAIVEVDKYSN